MFEPMDFVLQLNTGLSPIVTWKFSENLTSIKSHTATDNANPSANLEVFTEKGCFKTIDLADIARWFGFILGPSSICLEPSLGSVL